VSSFIKQCGAWQVLCSNDWLATKPTAEFVPAERDVAETLAILSKKPKMVLMK